MTHTITVACLKGGTGKSTVATGLAVAFHAAGHRVLLIDADPQGTLHTWASVAAENGKKAPPVVAIHGAALRGDVRRVGAAYDLVVIDCPPRHGIEQKAAILSADLVLIPVTPGGADLWALSDTLGVIDDAQGLRPELRAAIVGNMLDSRTEFSRGLRGALKTETEVPMMKATLGRRVTYAEAMTAGEGPTTYAPRSIAAKEMAALVRETTHLLSSPSKTAPKPAPKKKSKTKGKR